ncbi:GTP cyclohydrolase I FolE2 [bacterium]|nr:GTP cyclohydrolase I FolE2 [bacterium]
MPDVAEGVGPQIQGTLDRVGMSHIEVPVKVQDSNGELMILSAKADAYVNLVDSAAKGIHMSRLFLSMQKKLESEELTPKLVEEILTEFVSSHAGKSDSASLAIDFDYLIKRKALLSDNSGWRSYPVSVKGTLTKGVMRLELGVQVAYSSTCPCSAALSRQLIKEKFESDFSSKGGLSVDEVAEWLSKESSIVATPHSQRSIADVRIVMDRAAPCVTLLSIIDDVEGVLKTAVQTAVKREDEQEFARLNASNLMFCEDASRRMKAWLESSKGVVDYRIEARHVESLHAHDAVSIVTKGVDGGFRP